MAYSGDSLKTSQRPPRAANTTIAEFSLQVRFRNDVLVAEGQITDCPNPTMPACQPPCVDARKILRAIRSSTSNFRNGTPRTSSSV